jgi:hypothetical protein
VSQRAQLVLSAKLAAGAALAVLLVLGVVWYVVPRWQQHERFEAAAAHLRTRFGGAQCGAGYGAPEAAFAGGTFETRAQLEALFCGGAAGAGSGGGGGGGAPAPATPPSPCARALDDIFDMSSAFLVEDGPGPAAAAAPAEAALAGDDAGSALVLVGADGSIGGGDTAAAALAAAPASPAGKRVRARWGSWTLACRLQMAGGWALQRSRENAAGLALAALSAVALALLARHLREAQQQSAAVAQLAELAFEAIEQNGSPRLREADVRRSALRLFSPSTPRHGEAASLWPAALAKLREDERVAVETGADGAVTQLRLRRRT